MSTLEKDFWQGHRKRASLHSLFYDENKERLFWFWSIFFLVVCFCFYLGMWLASFKEIPVESPYITAEGYFASSVDDDWGKRIILVMGTDPRSSDVGRSDTIILAFLNSETDNVYCLSIPRDTYVQIAGSQEKTKINHAYAYGGVELSEATLENFLGITIDNYIKVDFAAFKQLVDAVGGVTVNVADRMFYKPEGIDLYPGEQLLDGDKALQYVRYREPIEADIGRIGRQQQFMQALSGQVLDIGNIWKMPTFIKIFSENVETDMSATDMLRIAASYRDAAGDNLIMSTLPGAGEYIDGISYWITEEATVAATVDSLLNPPEPAAVTGEDSLDNAVENTADNSQEGSRAN